jgi:hypothetical protein
MNIPAITTTKIIIITLKQYIFYAFKRWRRKDTTNHETPPYLITNCCNYKWNLTLQCIFVYEKL